MADAETGFDRAVALDLVEEVPGTATDFVMGEVGPNCLGGREGSFPITKGEASEGASLRDTHSCGFATPQVSMSP